MERSSLTGRSHKLIAATTCIVTLTSCGDLGVFSTSKKDVTENRETTFDDVMMLSMEDQDCNAGSESVALESAQIWEWNGTEIQPKQVPLKVTPSRKNGLESAGILAVARDQRDDRHVSLDSDNNQTIIKSATVSQGVPVRICRQDGVFTRESIESMTLNTQHYIAEAYTKLNTLKLDPKPSVSKSKLLVQYLRVSHYSKGDRRGVGVMVDNAAFGTAKEGSFFVVVPSSKSTFKQSPVHMWEVPFVLKHEFGHSIFNASVGKALAAVGLRASHNHGISGIFQTRDSKTQSALMLAEGRITELASGGVNELFADLFAFYSGSGIPGQMKGIIGLDVTRDPLSPVTAAGTPKEWSTLASDIFEGRRKARSDLPKGEPTYDGIHDVAAILSYPVVFLMESALKGQSADQKLELIINWLHKLAKVISESKGTANLDAMMTSLVTAVVANKTSTPEELKAACVEFSRKVSGLPSAAAACR